MGIIVRGLVNDRFVIFHSAHSVGTISMAILFNEELLLHASIKCMFLHNLLMFDVHINISVHLYFSFYEIRRGYLKYIC